jgi:hypothetical protein
LLPNYVHAAAYNSTYFLNLNRFSHLKMVDALEGGFLPSLPILDSLEHEHAADD